MMWLLIPASITKYRIIIMGKFERKKDEVLGEWRILYGMHYSVNIIRMIK